MGRKKLDNVSFSLDHKRYRVTLDRSNRILLDKLVYESGVSEAYILRRALNLYADKYGYQLPDDLKELAAVNRDSVKIEALHEINKVVLRKAFLMKNTAVYVKKMVQAEAPKYLIMEFLLNQKKMALSYNDERIVKKLDSWINDLEGVIISICGYDYEKVGQEQEKECTALGQGYKDFQKYRGVEE